MGASVILPAVIGAAAALVVDSLKGIANRHLDKRDKAAQQRELDFETIRDVVFEIRDLATEYWESPGNDALQKRRQASITGRLTFVLRLHEDLLSKPTATSPTAKLHMDDFYEVCTGDEFGSSTKIAMPEKCTDIEVAAYTVVHSCQRAVREI